MTVKVGLGTLPVKHEKNSDVEDKDDRGKVDRERGKRMPVCSIKAPALGGGGVAGHRK